MGGSSSSPLYENTPLGQPPLRISELDANSSRYDRARAAPPDSNLVTVWTIWSASFFIFATFNIIVFAGILSSRRTRRKPFNLYLLYLMVPDIGYTLFCAVQCAHLAANSGFVSSGGCQIQSFYLIFGLTANSWLNGVIAHELHTLLSNSDRRKRYYPPTLRKVTQNAAIVYAYSILIAGLGNITFPWWPHRTDLQNGLLCIPMDFNALSTALFWVLFFPLMSAVPLGYCVWVAFDVYRKDLLPPTGKRREITIYFYKITGVFLLMWLPGIFIFYAFSGLAIEIMYVAPVWSHSQGAVAAGVALMKKDVYDAARNFVLCRCQAERVNCESSRTDITGKASQKTGSSRFFSAQSLGRSIAEIVAAQSSPAHPDAEDPHDDDYSQCFSSGRDCAGLSGDALQVSLPAIPDQPPPSDVEMCEVVQKQAIEDVAEDVSDKKYEEEEKYEEATEEKTEEVTEEKTEVVE